LGPKDKKFILTRDVTFDEVSILKPTISQQVESDATSPSLERSVLLEIIPTVAQGSDHVADQDTDNDEDQGQAISDVHESISVGRTRRNPRKPSRLTTDMIVTYALLVIEEAIPSTYKETESVQSLRYEKMP